MSDILLAVFVCGMFVGALLVLGIILLAAPA